MTAENADGGLRLLNVRFHLEIVARKGGDPDPKSDPTADADAKKVAQLLAPFGAGIVCDDNNGNTVAAGDPNASRELIIKFTDDRASLAAGAKLAQVVELKCRSTATSR